MNLYKAWESIEEGAGPGGAVSRGWATDTERRRFTGTANSYGAVGDAARHAGFDLPASTMTIYHADDFVRGLLDRFLASLR